MWAILSRNQAVGQLILRLLLGGFILYVSGWKELAGGMEQWRKLGGYMTSIGVSFWLPFWGFVFMLAKTLGMVLIMIGFAFRPACLLITFCFAVIGYSVLRKSGLGEASQAFELAIVFFSMMFIGPGSYSVDKQ